MPVTGLDIIDTAVKIGLGAIIGLVSSFFLDRARHKRDLEKERLRLQYEDLVKPIVQFVDDLMALICQSYWNHLDRAKADNGEDIHEKIIAIRNKEGFVEARVRALGNPSLSEPFKKFTRQLFSIQMDLGERKLKEAGDKKENAFKLSGDILAILYRITK